MLFRLSTALITLLLGGNALAFTNASSLKLQVYSVMLSTSAQCTNPFTVLLILGSLPLVSLSDCLSILALLSGALGVGLCRKSSATTSPERYK